MPTKLDPRNLVCGSRLTAHYLDEVANQEFDLVTAMIDTLEGPVGSVQNHVVIKSNPQCLRAFLTNSRRILEPVVQVAGHRALVPITDLGRIGDRSLAHLKTSNGRVSRRDGADYACWETCEDGDDAS